MKIHIMGGSGTGKSYIAERLSKKYNIPHYDLDNFFWDNSANQYGMKMPVDKRTKMLNDVVVKDNWIIEGVYYSWLTESFERADYIFILETPKLIYKFRIIKRFIKRKLGLERAKKETLKSLKNLLRWTDKFQQVNMPEILFVLEKYQEKTVILKSKKDIYMYIK